MKTSIFKEIRIPKIIFTEKAYWDITSLMGSTFAKTKEFACVGLVESASDDWIIVERFFLCPNTQNSAAYCEINGAKYTEWTLNNFKANERNRLRVHAHSHVNMGVSPSGTDNEAFIDKAKNISDYYVQLIFNHKEEHTINLCDCKTGIKYEGLSEYILIQDYIYDRAKKQFFMWNKEDKTLGSSPVISDGNVEIKDNKIQINDILSCLR